MTAVDYYFKFAYCFASCHHFVTSITFILQQGGIDEPDDGDDDDDEKETVYGVTTVINLTFNKVC